MTDKHDDSIDSPWQRLPWTILISLTIWGALAWGFGFVIETALPHSVKPSTAARSIYTQFVHLQMPIDKTAAPEAKPPDKPEPTPEPQHEQSAHGNMPTVKSAVASPPPPSGQQAADNATSTIAQQNDNASAIVSHNENATDPAGAALQGNDNASAPLFIDLGYPR
ncbi:MAG: hypothetical protein L7F77_14570 [Candidatus Magnetominusculus sp. LBB02]|nr:hypothetical protein [Candidatus Magnetominusculus sp. LBB02]